jgi:hypothetical protein
MFVWFSVMVLIMLAHDDDVSYVVVYARERMQGMTRLNERPGSHT